MAALRDELVIVRGRSPGSRAGMRAAFHQPAPSRLSTVASCQPMAHLPLRGQRRLCRGSTLAHRLPVSHQGTNAPRRTSNAFHITRRSTLWHHSTCRARVKCRRKRPRAAEATWECNSVYAGLACATTCGASEPAIMPAMLASRPTSCGGHMPSGARISIVIHPVNPEIIASAAP